MRAKIGAATISIERGDLTDREVDRSRSARPS